MKKIIYALLIAFASSMVVTACTEEEVAPSADNGGTVPDPGAVK